MKQFRYRGEGPDVSIVYQPGDFVYSAKRGYLVRTVRGTWEPMVNAPDPSDRGPKGDKGDSIVGPAGRDGMSIVGPKGDKGEPGERGERGPRGERGYRGYDGDTYVSMGRQPAEAAAILGVGTFDSTTARGSVLYVSGDGHVDLALGSGTPQALAVGVAIEDVASGQIGRYATSGPVQVPGPLTPGAVYYLSPTSPGGMTETFPNEVGDHVVILGAATTQTELVLAIKWALVIGS